MQSVSSRIWTRVAVSISYDDNDYTTGTWLMCHKTKLKHLTVCKKNRLRLFKNIIYKMSLQSVGYVPVMLELRGMRKTHL